MFQLPDWMLLRFRSTLPVSLVSLIFFFVVVSNAFLVGSKRLGLVQVKICVRFKHVKKEVPLDFHMQPLMSSGQAGSPKN